MYFRILLDRISPALKSIARRHLLYSFYDEEDLYQEMCLYVWQHYRNGLPIGINESYVIKGCEFHIQNFLRKGRPKAPLQSLDKLVGTEGLTLADILEDKNAVSREGLERDLTVDELKGIGLTDRERSVLSYLIKGYTVREAARELGISHVMVVKHKKAIIAKWRKKKGVTK